MSSIDMAQRRAARMHSPLTPPLESERGFTLVEMMVAVMLLGIILAALASVIITSLTAVQRDEFRVRATQLGQEELERLRALEWDCVAFDPADPDYAATYNGNETVALDPAACSNLSIAPDPSPTVRTVDGIDYTVVSHIYWIDDPEDDPATESDPDPHDYKEFHVAVSWTLRGTNYSYENTSTRVPTVEEVPLEDASTAAGFEIVSAQVDPLVVNTSSGSGTDQPITVTVETSLEATLVTLTVASPSTYGSVNLSDISGDGTRWQVTIPAGNTAFPVGDHEFLITATGALGTDTASQMVTFAETVVQPVTVKTPFLLPSTPICVDNNSKTHTAVTVTVDIDGVSLADQVQMSWTDKSGNSTGAPSGLTATGARFIGVIPLGHQFQNATTTLTVQARRLNDNSVATGSYVISIAKQNNILNCP